MLQTKTILAAIPHCLETITLSKGKKLQGKVRDFYLLKNPPSHKASDGQSRIIITTDRQSAFDVHLGLIPYKGTVLNLLAAFWFSKTKHIIPNHIMAIPDPNVTIAKNLQPIPVEMVVRGYMTGVTITAIWPSYKNGERIIYGVPFPDGLTKNQKLPTPIITPTYHGDRTGKGGHDTRLTKNEIIKEKIVPRKIYEAMEKASLALFAFGSKTALKNGLILVDTKYEFGLDQKGKLFLMDEIHTPDSSRFWIKKTYKNRIKKGWEPENFDKEFLRLWYAEKGYNGDGKPPKMTKELIVDLSKRYIAIYEMITGERFKAFKYPIQERIQKNLKKYLTIDDRA